MPFVEQQGDILVVEDDPSTALMIEEILGGAKHVVRVVNTPEEALAAVRERKPDLALMDVHLSSDIDGIETARRINEIFDVPVCYISAHSDSETLARAESTGPFAFLIKPFEVAEISTMVTVSLQAARRKRPEPPPQAAPEAAPAAPSTDIFDTEAFIDTATGLPNRAAIEARFRQDANAAFAAVLIVDHAQVLRQRFGVAALEQIILAYSQHLAQQLPEACTLCRWSQYVFVALPHDGGQDSQRDIARATTQPLLHHLQLTGRSAMLRVTCSYRFIQQTGAGSIIEQVDSYVQLRTKR